MSDVSAPQPSVVRAATILIVVSSLLTILESVSTIRNIGSFETVDALNKALSLGWGASSHISITTLQDTLRVAANVAAVLAAAVGVLAIFAGRGSRQARTALAVLALPVLLASLIAAGYAGLGILIGIAMLWSRGAREWFAPVASVVTPVQPVSPPLTSAPTAPASPVASSLPIHPSGAPTPPMPVPVTNRPPGVTAAGVVAIVLSGLAAAGGLLGGIALAVMQGRPDLRQSFIDRLHQDRISMTLSDFDRYLTAVTIAAIVLGVLGLLGVLAGALVLRGSPQARVALIVLSAVCAVLSLLMITSIVSVVWLVGSLWVILGLRSADAAAWFKQR